MAANLLSKGQLINDAYEVLSFIGEGGIGVVYKVLQLDLQRVVAVKVLKEEYVRSEEWLARFQREGRVLASLRHHNIVSCYVAGLFHARVPFLVIEYLQGKSLRELIREKGCLDLLWSLEMVIQVCSALEHAHAQNIVHRDLKPENIMLVEVDGSLETVKVLDFGLAAVLETEEELTRSGILIGSANYMSPEQCHGKKVDPRSDIYSSACILYECLSGFPPHEADTALGLIYKHTNEYPQKLGERRSNVPEALDMIILKAMAKDPAHRYQCAADMRMDIVKLKDSIENQIELGASQIDLSPAVLQAASRSRGKLFNTAIVGLVLAIVAGFAALFFFLSDPGPASLLAWSASFCPAKNRLSFLERAGDQLASQRRNRAADFLYTHALACKADALIQMRLLSKISISALHSGNKREAARSAVAYFNVFLDPSRKKPEIDSFKRILSVIESVPVGWNDDVYRKLSYIRPNPSNSDYELSYNTLFALTIADTSYQDEQMRRLQHLFLTILAAEFHNDQEGKERIILWTRKHLAKFHNYRRLLEPALSKLASEPRNASGKGSLLQSVIDTCTSLHSIDSPECVCMLLAAARTYSYIDLDRKETFKYEKLQTILPDCKSSEASIVVNLLIGQAFAARSDYADYLRYTREAVRILSKIEDRYEELGHPFQELKDWVVHTITADANICPSGFSGKFELLKELDQCLVSSPRLVDPLTKDIMTDLYNESLELYRYGQAEKIMQDHIKILATSDNRRRQNGNRNLYEVYFLFSELYRHEEKFPAMKAVLLEADHDIKANEPPPETTIPVLDAWSNYYYYANDDPAKAKACAIKALHVAELTGDADLIASRELNILEWGRELETKEKQLQNIQKLEFKTKNSTTPIKRVPG